METRQTYTEDSDYLMGLGIYIPGKKSFSNKGYIKLYTEDFIVEEITNEGLVASIKDQQAKEIPQSDQKQNFKLTLIKDNIGTLEAIRDLAQKLNIDTTNIQHAGIKDNDALTAQKITIQNVSSDELLKISSPNYRLTNLEICESKLRIGELKGNRFTLLVRFDQDELNKEELLEKINHVQENGFYNFYYSQRFGTLGRDNNHILGLLMLQNKKSEAIFRYLTDAPKSCERNLLPLYEKILDNYGNWELMKEIFTPHADHFENELKIVNYLIDNPGDYDGALDLNPDNVRFWILGFASWLFNIKLSKYLIDSRELPKKINLITSVNKNVINDYRDELRLVELNEFSLDHLVKFKIQSATYPVDTKKTVKFNKTEFTDQGLLLQFDLDKGSYATTALAHCFDLIIGTIPDGFSKEKQRIS